MSAEHKERCGTCRWWIDPRKPTESDMNWLDLALAREANEEKKAYLAECLEVAKANMVHGVGDCRAMPDVVRNVSGAHWCGQWRAQDANA